MFRTPAQRLSGSLKAATQHPKNADVIRHKAQKPLRTRLTGAQLMQNPVLNKGSAFTREERAQFGLEALLPYEVHTLELQTKRVYQQLQTRSSPLSKYTFLTSLRDQNEVLFYHVVLHHLRELLSVIYTPTVGDAISEYSSLFRRPSASADAIFLSYPDKGSIRDLMLTQRNPKDIDLIVVTDGEGILGIGDQGAGGILICAGKSQIYTLGAGIDPSRILSVMLDVGTNNQELLDDPLYLGWREKRRSGQEYDEFVDEFFKVVREDFPGAMLHCEDFGVSNASRLLSRYREKQSVFNDDMQGTAAVVLAALLSAAKVTKKALNDQRIVIFGFGTAGVGIADGIKKGMTANSVEGNESVSSDAAHSKFWAVDRFGLLVDDMDGLREGQKLYARSSAEVKDWARNEEGHISLLEVVKQAKPTVLIGCSTVKGAFNKEVVEEMHKHCDRPIIFPLSNPTRLAECDPKDANQWTKGKALIATGSPFPATKNPNGKTYEVAEANNALVYPGLGLGVVVSRSSKLTDYMITAGVEALAELSPALKDPDASLLPTLEHVRRVSIAIGTAVANAARQEGVSQLDRSKDFTEEDVLKAQWDPVYRPLELVGHQ